MLTGGGEGLSFEPFVRLSEGLCTKGWNFQGLRDFVPFCKAATLYLL